MQIKSISTIIVSIHAPAWGATYDDVRLFTGYLTFQSTRPRGARLVLLWQFLYKEKGFNPRARVGRDNLADPTRHKVVTFQSTRPRGARRYIAALVTQDPLFQSTRPRGARRLDDRSKALDGRFQSTRPRGARHDWRDRSSR